MNKTEEKKTDSNIIYLRFFTRKDITDDSDVDFPSGKTDIERTLELDLECATVPLCIGPRVGDIGNLERRNYKAICLLISEKRIGLVKCIIRATYSGQWGAWAYPFVVESSKYSASSRLRKALSLLNT